MMSLIRNRTLNFIIRNILIVGSIFFIGCEDITYSGEGEPSCNVRVGWPITNR